MKHALSVALVFLATAASADFTPAIRANFPATFPPPGETGMALCAGAVCADGNFVEIDTTPDPDCFLCVAAPTNPWTDCTGPAIEAVGPVYIGEGSVSPCDGCASAGAGDLVVRGGGVYGTNTGGTLVGECTVDGTDNRTTYISGADAANTSRSGYGQFEGNEATGAGRAIIVGGNVATGTAGVIRGSTAAMAYMGGSSAAPSAGAFCEVNGNTHAAAGVAALEGGNVAGGIAYIRTNHATPTVRMEAWDGVVFNTFVGGATGFDMTTLTGDHFTIDPAKVIIGNGTLPCDAAFTGGDNSLLVEADIGTKAQVVADGGFVAGGCSPRAALTGAALTVAEAFDIVGTDGSASADITVDPSAALPRVDMNAGDGAGANAQLNLRGIGGAASGLLSSTTGTATASVTVDSTTPQVGVIADDGAGVTSQLILNGQAGAPSIDMVTSAAGANGHIRAEGAGYIHINTGNGSKTTSLEMGKSSSSVIDMNASGGGFPSAQVVLDGDAGFVKLVASGQPFIIPAVASVADDILTFTDGSGHTAPAAPASLATRYKNSVLRWNPLVNVTLTGPLTNALGTEFPFEGSSNDPAGLADAFCVTAASNNVVTASATIRLQDTTNAATLATITIPVNSTKGQFCDAGVSNVPGSFAAMEVQSTVAATNVVTVYGAYWIRYR